MTIPITRYNGCIVPLTLRRHRPMIDERQGAAGGVEGAVGGVEGVVGGVEGAVGGVEGAVGGVEADEQHAGVEGGEQVQPGGELDVVWLNPHCAGAEFLRPFLMSFEPETTPMVSVSWLS